MLFILRTGKQERSCQHFHHKVHEEKKEWTLNTITIGKQLINCIGRKATHPKTFTILSLRGAQATRQSSPNRPHKHRLPLCIRTSGPPPVIASHKEARQSSGTEYSRLPALPLDCHVGPKRDPPRNDKVVLYHRKGITRNIPSGKDLFPLRDLHALHGQCFPFFRPLRQKPIHCFTFTMKTVKKRRNRH
jgi:hypothetical protein